MFDKIKEKLRINKYQGISSDEIPVGSWEYDELNLTSSGDPFRNLTANEVLDFGKRRWQDGSGSCFPSDTKVLMEDFSQVEISKIKLGDNVFTHNGNIRPVTHLFKKKWQGNTQKIKVRGLLDDIICTSEHPIYAVKATPGKKPLESHPDFYESKDIKRGDWVAFPMLPNTKDTTVRKFESDPDFLWALGLYLAEGSVDKYKVAFSLHKKETYYYERLKRTFAKYGSNVTVSLKKEGDGMCVSLQGKRWAEIFLELGGKLCENKKISDRLMFINPNLQMNILEGVFDGDGCYTENRSVLVSTSETLVTQMKRILLRNGIYSFSQSRKKLEDRKQVWVLEYSKTSRYSFIKGNFLFVQVVSNTIQKKFSGGHVYNLEVEGDNSYIVNGGVAVHNCVAQTCAGMNDQFTGFETSATPIYKSRSNKPAAGMSYEDVVKLLPKTRIVLEKDTPSQSMNDSQMDSQNINGESFNPVLEPFLLPRSFDEVAKAVRQQGCASIWFRGTFDEWQRWIIDSLASQSNQVRHSVKIVDAVRVDGVEYLVALDSAGYYRTDSVQPKWLKTDGLRAITRKAFEQGAFNQWTVRQLNIVPPVGKPQHRFEYNLKFGMLNNDDVRKLQEILIYEGLLDKDAKTGNYKNMTRSAVKAFQLKHKVASVQEITQIAGMSVGPKTRKVLNELYA